MSRSLAAALITSLFCAACHVNPVTNRPQVILTSRDTEKSLGDQEARKVEATIGVVEDERLAAYISAIGERLTERAPANDYEFRFKIINMEEPNAFALPGGSVYVSRGLLILAGTEDQLAGVIGHEIAHVLGRDAGNRISLGAPLGIVTGIGAAATGIISPTLGNVIGGIGGVTQGLLLSPHDRQQERNADTYALDLTAKAGWRPEGLPEILHSLERYEALQGEDARALSFFASHPRTPERVRDTGRAAASIQHEAAPPIAASDSDFLSRLDGIVVGDDPAAGVFAGQQFIQPDMQLTLRFPDGWQTHNSWNQVAALDPDKHAMAVLTLAGEGDDPNAIAHAIAKQSGLDSKTFREIQINGLRAVRSGVITGRSNGRSQSVEATWIAFQGNVYQIACITTPDRLEQYRTPFKQIPHSFRATTADDLAKVRVVRLRIHRARAGESLAALLKRVGSPWDAKTAAVANALTADAALAEGTLVKAPLTEPYVPK